MKTLCHYISELAHGDKSREFLNKPVNNLSLTANDGGGAISIVATKGLSLLLGPSFLVKLSLFSAET